MVNVHEINKSVGLPCFDPFTLKQIPCGTSTNIEYGYSKINTLPIKINDLKLDGSYRICQSCEHRDPTRDQCKYVTCGCFLNSWAKRATSRCSQDKFDNLSDFVNYQREEHHYHG